MLKDIFGFTEHQEKVIYGLGHIITLTKNTDIAVLNKGNPINNAKIKIDSRDCTHIYADSCTTKNIIESDCKKNGYRTSLSRTISFREEVNTQNLWNFELGTQESINVPI